jgi:hypothetical protein
VEVKIDADELCRLKKENEKLKGRIEDLRRANQKLCYNLSEAHAGNVDYAVKCDWVGLKKERDWWRKKAVSLASELDHLDSSVCDLFQFSPAAGQMNHWSSLRCSAEDQGYKVSHDLP